jgi:hypothetical protein
MLRRDDASSRRSVTTTIPGTAIPSPIPTARRVVLPAASIL